MKNKLLKNTFRSIKKAPGRFAAIMAIIAISCSFYTGVKAACPDMKASAWRYYDEYALADIQIKSTLGFNSGDVERILADERFDKGYAGYSADLFTDTGNGPAAVKLLSYSADSELNLPYLIEGRLPEKADECLADCAPGQKLSFSVGDKITLTAPADDDIGDYLNRSEYTIVGTIMSPQYVSVKRGVTDIGTGSLEGFLFIPEESFAYEAYTDIYLSAAAAHSSEIEPFSEEYEEKVSEAEFYLEGIAASFLDERKADIRTEVDDELSDARKKLADGQKEFDDGKKEYDKGLADYQSAFDEISKQRKEFNDGKQEYEDGIKLLDENQINMEALAYTCTRIDKFLKDYDGIYMKVLPDALLNVFKEIQKAYDDNSVECSIEDLMAVYIITDPEKDPASKAAAKAAIEGVNEQVRAASAAALEEIEAQRKLLEETGKQLEEAESALTEYEDELKDAKHELDEGKKELDEAQKKIDDANLEIADAENELEEMLSDSKWYIWNRDEFNPNCYSYGEDAERVDSIASAFPIFFILIAALVCSTTMSRMVEEQRTETGTMKALGFGSFSIIMQYVLYAVMASLIGSVVGCAIGFPLLPRIINYCYTTMYAYPEFEAPFMPAFAVGCMVVALLCTGLSAVYTAVKELTGVPAQLIRPKPPRSGRRIFLEKIGFIWNNMSFGYKVSFRNLLRYKRRFFMMLVGIGGCTALLLTGFGLKEGISCISGKQYDEIFTYDIMAVLGDETTENELVAIENVIASEDVITGHMYAIQESKDVFSETASFEAYVLAPENAEMLGEYITMRSRTDGSPIAIEQGTAVITEKLSRLLDVKVGDTISIDGGILPLKISAITENYAFHYVYIDQTTYNNVFGNADNNVIMMNTGDTPDKATRERICEALISCDGMISATFLYDGADTFRQLVSSLNIIVVVIIAFVGALAFVIQYNLANININERVRELATIKVLGFFDNEVGSYVYRENTISGIVGIIVGLFVGIFFESFVIKTCEVNEVMFSPDIPWECFVLSAVTMILFMVIVNAVLFIKLKKIDMAASMKAIE